MNYGPARAVGDQYAAATGHYASPARNDPVKVRWERPWFALMLAGALRFLLSRLPSSRRSLTVVDVGAGAGEGFELLATARRYQPAGPSLRYVGVDRSGSMAALAERRLATVEGFDRVVQADIRDVDFSRYDADLYLSAGAPYSEVPADHLERVLSRILAAAAATDRPAAVFVDVYGEYCPAWLPIAAPRRQYAMSFFHDTLTAPTAVMEFYTPARLKALLQRAMPPRLRPRAALEFVDRSVFAGRHTSTLAYNPQLPPIRTIVNNLLAGHADPTALSKLRIPPEACVPAPTDPTARTQIRHRVQSWNRVLDRRDDSSVLTSLRRLNNVRGPHASGIGHYLTAIIRVGPSPVTV